MASKLLKTVSKFDTIEAAWRVIRENARASLSQAVRQEVEEFAKEPNARIRSICWHLSHNQFAFGTAKGIPLPKRDASGRKTGKYRPIVLASLEARIVQRAVLDVLQTVPKLQAFAQTPLSFGGIRKLKPLHETDHGEERLSAVPAAIQAVLDEIANGARYYVCADIRSFFTRISKPNVIEIVGAAVADPEFLEFFKKAISTELSNIEELRGTGADFPTEEIGVAQGNSLSPLLGNITLSKFDLEMNRGDCRCIRYIDDFIILAPSAKAANTRLRMALRLLKELGCSFLRKNLQKGPFT